MVEFSKYYPNLPPSILSIKELEFSNPNQALSGVIAIQINYKNSELILNIQ